MKIPKGMEDRRTFIKDVLDKCLNTQGDRQTRDKRLRQWFMYGNDGTKVARFNKVLPACELLTSFLYAQETTRFSVELGTAGSPTESEKSDILSRRIGEFWHDGNGDKIFQSVVLWGNVAAQMIKMQWIKGELKYYQMDSCNFGVLREDVTTLDEQEAMVHSYRITKSELRRILLLGGKLPGEDSKVSSVDELLDQMSVTSSQTQATDESFIGRLVISQSTPNMVGAIADMGSIDMTRDPVVKEDLVRMAELWVWDDDASDYRVFTIADDNFVVFDRPNIFVPHESPFVLVVQEPIPNYIWGNSVVERLIPLQMWRESRMNDIDTAWKRQLKPPMLATGGMMGINDEKYAAFLREGGVISSQLPGAKMEPVIPKLPEETFSEIQQIDQMFDETIGLTSIMQGQGEQGVRGESHANLLASMSGSRVKQKALLIEAALEKIATLTLKVLQQEDKTLLHTDSGETFAAAQFTQEYSVKVAAHTSSPIFASNLKQDALMLHGQGVIDGETLIELYDPPMAPVLIQRLKKQEQQKQQQLQQVAQMLPPEEKAGFFARIFGGGGGKAKK